MRSHTLAIAALLLIAPAVVASFPGDVRTIRHITAHGEAGDWILIAQMFPSGSNSGGVSYRGNVTLDIAPGATAVVFERYPTPITSTQGAPGFPDYPVRFISTRDAAHASYHDDAGNYLYSSSPTIVGVTMTFAASVPWSVDIELEVTGPELTDGPFISQGHGATLLTGVGTHPLGVDTPGVGAVSLTVASDTPGWTHLQIDPRAEATGYVPTRHDMDLRFANGAVYGSRYATRDMPPVPYIITSHATDDACACNSFGQQQDAAGDLRLDLTYAGATSGLTFSYAHLPMVASDFPSGYHPGGYAMYLDM